MTAWLPTITTSADLRSTRRCRARSAARQLALGAQRRVGRDMRRVRVALTGTGVLPDDLRLRLVHPTRAVADELIELHAVAPGDYEGMLATPVAGTARRDAGGHGAHVAAERAKRRAARKRWCWRRSRRGLPLQRD